MLYWIFTIWNEAHEAGESWAESFSFLRLLGYITVRGIGSSDILWAVFGFWATGYSQVDFT